MSHRPAITLVFGLATVAAVLACAGGSALPEAVTVDGASGDAGDAENAGSGRQTSLPVTEPWLSMGLPTDDGRVIYSDPTGMMISYGQSFQSVSDGFTGVLLASGWTEDEDFSDVAYTAIAYHKDGAQVGLIVSGDARAAMVTMEDLGKVPVSESQIDRARRGERTADPAAATSHETRTLAGTGSAATEGTGSAPSKSSGTRTLGGGEGGSTTGTRTLGGSEGGSTTGTRTLGGDEGGSSTGTKSTGTKSTGTKSTGTKSTGTKSTGTGSTGTGSTGTGSTGSKSLGK